MYILAFDTSSKIDSCSISKDNDILSSITYRVPSNKSEKILDLIDFTLKSVCLDISDIDLIASCKGPGSFVGTRIASATAIAIGKAIEKKVLAVSSKDIEEYIDVNSKDENKLTKSDIIAKIVYENNDEKDNLDILY